MYSFNDAAKDAAFEQAAAAPVTEPTALLCIGDDEDDPKLGPSSVQSLSVTKTLGGETFAIGDVQSSQMTAVVLTADLPRAFEAEPFYPSMGFVIGEQRELVPMGQFFTADGSVHDDGMFTTIKAYDVLFFMEDVVTTETNSLNPRTAMQALSTTFGFPLDASSVPTAGTVSVPAGKTLRDVVSAIAAGCWRNVVTDHLGRVTFVLPSGNAGKPHFSFTASDLAGDGFSIDPATAPTYGKMECEYTWYEEKKSEDDYDAIEHNERVVYPSSDPGVSSISIDPGLFGEMPTDLASSNALKAKFNSLSALAVDLGTKMRGFTISVHGRPQMQPGDSCTVKDAYNRRYGSDDDGILALMSVTHTFNGGIKTSATCKSSSEERSSYEDSKSVSQTIKAVREEGARFRKVVAADIVAKNADITNLKAQKADIDFANVNTLNVNEEFVQKLMVQGKLIANDGEVFKLTSVHVDANDITTGTLTVDRLQLLGSDGLYYALNVSSMGETELEKLPESVQEECKSKLHADSIVANSITAEQITTSNLVGTGGWINLASGTFEYSNATSGNFISWDGSKLKLNVDSINIGGNPVPSSDDIDEAKKTATNFIEWDSADGAVIVGNGIDGEMSGSRAVIKPSAFTVVEDDDDGNPQQVASFGKTTEINAGDSKVVIDGDSLGIERNGEKLVDIGYYSYVDGARVGINCISEDFCISGRRSEDDGEVWASSSIDFRNVAGAELGTIDIVASGGTTSSHKEVSAEISLSARGTRSSSISTNSDYLSINAADVSIGCDYISIMGSNLADFVVERGTDSNGWQYRNWYSGRLEAWKSLSLGTLSFTAATGGGYASVSGIKLPSGLLYQPWVQLTASQSGAAYFISATASYVNKSTFQANIARHFGTGSANVVLSAYVVGTWK